MRVIFMGTAPFACPTLQRLLSSTHQVALVVTQPDRPRGRGQRPAASAVKELALVSHCPLMQPARLRPPAVVEALAAFQPDVIVVVAYGNILPATVLQLPPYGCINVHASLLPKYRGAAPINWTLIHGETVTGCTIIQMDEHIDTGPILWQTACAVAPEDDAVRLGARLAELGATGLLEVLSALEQGTLTAQPQPEVGASYAPKLSRDLGRLDWQQPAPTLHDLIRGLVPWPGATTRFRELEVKIWRSAVSDVPPTQAPGTITTITPESIGVACGTQQLLVHELQPANRRRMAAKDFVQGYRLQQGQRFD
jgi:methionyl-tRNA formyltransferase